MLMLSFCICCVNTLASSEPYIELSTPHAAFAEGLTDRPDGLAERWKHVSVTLAELSAATSTCEYRGLRRVTWLTIL